MSNTENQSQAEQYDEPSNLVGPPDKKKRKTADIRLLTSSGELPRVIAVMPEDVEMPSDPEHPLFDRRSIEPLDMVIYADIRDNGQRVPIAIREKPGVPGKYEIIDGRTRLRSGRQINIDLGEINKPPRAIPALVYYCPDDVSAVLMKHSFNEMRNERDALGKAEGMVEALKFGASLDEVAELFRCNKKTVQRAKKLIKEGSDGVKKALRDGDITLRAAIELVSNYNTDKQDIALGRYIAQRNKLDTVFVGEEPEKKEGKSGKPKVKSLKREVYVNLVRDLRSNDMDKKSKVYSKDEMAKAVADALDYASGTQTARAKVSALLEEIGFSEPDPYLDGTYARKSKGKKESKEAKAPKATKGKSKKD